ncbi:LacI family DNA-binding transcriptional regulator [Paenibacillus radicis (ex Gao et al. 2016)]|uniref:LacI family transcriptional regulator n=1 Tax=Paenibacillus radicis (ex Gao et al. 2016) TaxID=1737354 RepID=A0A917HAZ0_9BACL|nr:LacI family DNA-binding transcriptional regulator [Paenibacillus radicis (ex Gao et al. 2016)]GGG73466.1 LacI family transcriptional regulator [Paenibacillus radicis (ex Gao et al. 2016)]
MRPTIKNIALELQLAVSTVSRALNGSYGVHPKTIERVQQKARELGYVPDLGAQQLAGKRSNFIGVFSPEFDFEATPEFAELFPPMHKALRLLGKDVLVFSVPFFDYEPGKLEQWVALRNLSGIIVLPGFGRDHPMLLEALVLEMPCVNFSGACGPRCSTFTGGDHLGGKQAGAYLGELGHLRVGILSGPESLRICRDRYLGFREGYEQSTGYSPPDMPMAFGDFSGASGGSGALELWRENPDITAIFCMNDLMAMGAVAALSEAGVRIPEELSVIGYDGAFFTAYTNPPLTTIRHPYERLGERAVELLMDLIDGGTGLVFDGLPPQLIRRRTTSPYMNEDAAGKTTDAV